MSNWQLGHVGRVGIRRFVARDANDLLFATQETAADVWKWMSWYQPAYELSHALAFVSSCDAEWQARRRYSFAIYDTGDDTLLGSVGLSAIDHVHRGANLGYWVRRSRWGQGVASGAVSLAVNFAFHELDLNRVEFLIAVGNAASIRVAQKAGAQCEGVLRAKLTLQGNVHDALLYSLLRPELNQEKDPKLDAACAHCLVVA